jgi:hypothetical protein
VPWHRRRSKFANFGTVAVLLMITVICIAMLVWAAFVLDVRLMPGSDAGN